MIQANRQNMDRSPPTCKLSAAFDVVSDLLTQARTGRSDPELVDPGSEVVGLHSSKFSSLEDFKTAYLARQGPVLCVLRPAEVADASAWIRKSDDISLLNEPDALQQWRMDRISQLHDRRRDSLTCVFTRDELISALQRACQNSSPHQPVSLVLLDVDHLKSINDQFGVGVGNQVLKQIATLVKTICKNSFVSRTRGGEFAVLIHANGSIAKQIAAVLQDAVANHTWTGHDAVTASFGVATVYEQCEPSTILTQTDEALFAAKALGRNQVVCHSEIVDVSQIDSDQLEVISLENKARVMSERVTSFVSQQSKRIMRTLHREANTDALTQLFNRRYLDKRLGDEFNLSIVNGLQLSVALVDLDHFGKVNKTYGWPTGDKALCTVAKTITSSIRSVDWVGRYGGEEICIVMPNTNLTQARIVCERVRSAIAATPVNTNAKPINITVSIGVAQLDVQSDQSVVELIERVSHLTLKAKSRGRNQVQS